MPFAVNVAKGGGHVRNVVPQVVDIEAADSVVGQGGDVVRRQLRRGYVSARISVRQGDVVEAEHWRLAYRVIVKEMIAVNGYLHLGLAMVAILPTAR